VWDALKRDARTMLVTEAGPFAGGWAAKPTVILMVGVNGAGKTTTIAKLADRYKEEGKKVLLAAGDTFRAAAVQQLEMWGRRVGVPVYKGKEGARPSAVIFEAVQQGVKDGVDVIIADTAGRLQTKAPLMEELRKINDACGKALGGAPHETLLVLDATTGQNAISQAKEFSDALKLSGVVLTKLDGTAKGGVILAVAEEFKLPVRFIGVGEKSHDLREFDADDFVDALFARADEEAA
jgi:fused signal recognition particle receptor